MVTPPSIVETCERFPNQETVVQNNRPRRCTQARAGFCALDPVMNMRKCVYYPDIKPTTPADDKILHPQNQTSTET